MKVTVNNLEKEEVIDWNKVQLVRYKKSNDLYVVLTNGKSTTDNFDGTIIYTNIKDNDGFILGKYKDCFLKRYFKPFHGSITLQND